MKNGLPRERIPEVAAWALLDTLSDKALSRVVRRGFEEYQRVAKPIYAQWSFSQDEYLRMFHILKSVHQERRHGGRPAS